MARYIAVPGADVVEALPTPSASRETVVDGYTRTALPLFLQLRGHLCLHASAVMTERGVVVFAGPSGAGKSTLAAAVARRGYPQWADDAVAVSTESGHVMAVPLPFSPRLAPSAEQLVLSVPSTSELVAEPADRPQRMRAVFVLDRVASDPPRVVRLDAASSLKAVVDNSYRFSVEQADDRRRFVENQLGLVAGATVLRAHVRTEPDAFRAAVEMIIESVETLPDFSP